MVLLLVNAASARYIFFIIETSALQQKDLHPTVKGFDKNDVYIVETCHPTSNKLLGFIRLKNGTLEFTNFKAHLSRNALNLGESTKRDNKEAAGTHGEGFKVASPVMVRSVYGVRYEASNFYWKMKFAEKFQRILYCFLTDAKPSQIQKLQQSHSEQVDNRASMELNNNIWEDFSVKIGKVSSGGAKIEKNEFLKWIELCLDLNPPLC